jgi:hypothetical protein
MHRSRLLRGIAAVLLMAVSITAVAQPDRRVRLTR